MLNTQSRCNLLTESNLIGITLYLLPISSKYCSNSDIASSLVLWLSPTNIFESPITTSPPSISFSNS